MSSVNDLKTSKFLKKEDVGNGALATIRAVTQENVAKEGADPEMRYALHFDEFEKPMILNITNGELIADITGVSDDIEAGWIGWHVVLFNDPTVTFGNERKGGIRIRSPKPGSVTQPGPEKKQNTSDLPF